VIREVSSPTIPDRIATLLSVVRVLLGYGRHLAATVTHRAAAPSFTTIAACFGTIDLAVILAHLQRGILRATALQHVLLARADSGRDIELARARIRARNATSAPADSTERQQPTPRAARKAAPRPSRRSPWDDIADFHTPTLAQLEAQVRRRPLGRTLVDICLDLAVVPGLCAGPFWNELFDAVRCYGGSIAALMRERCKREEAFSQEQDRHPVRGWNWWDGRRQTVRQALGFFIGEEPVIPLSPSASSHRPRPSPPARPEEHWPSAKPLRRRPPAAPRR
jgi:hypothetical protein